MKHFRFVFAEDEEILKLVSIEEYIVVKKYKSGSKTYDVCEWKEVKESTKRRLVKKLGL